MRQALWSLGGIVAAVGVALLIVSVVVVHGVSVKTEGIDKTMQDVTTTLSDSATTLDNAAASLGKMNKDLADIKEAQAAVARAHTQVSTVDKNLKAWADHLKSTDGALNLWPLELTAGDFNAAADSLEALNLNATWFRSWANYLKRENRVIVLSPSDIANLLKAYGFKGYENVLKGYKVQITDDDFASAAKRLDPIVKSLGDTSQGMKNALSDAHTSLSNTQSRLNKIAGDLRATNKHIKAIDISGQIESKVDWLNGIISNLKLYMIISSIMFILAGAGIVLAGFCLGRGQTS